MKITYCTVLLPLAAAFSVYDPLRINPCYVTLVPKVDGLRTHHLIFSGNKATLTFTHEATITRASIRGCPDDLWCFLDSKEGFPQPAFFTTAEVLTGFFERVTGVECVMCGPSSKSAKDHTIGIAVWSNDFEREDITIEVQSGYSGSIPFNRPVKAAKVISGPGEINCFFRYPSGQRSKSFTKNRWLQQSLPAVKSIECFVRDRLSMK